MNEIRFKLDDIIDNDAMIKDVLLALNEKDKKKISKIVFWKNGNITDNKINYFLNIVNNIMHHPNTVKITNRTPQTEHIWFDIISDRDNKILDNKYRFSYVYSHANKRNILNGISKFYYVMNFVEESQGKKIIYKKENNVNSGNN